MVSVFGVCRGSEGPRSHVMLRILLLHYLTVFSAQLVSY